MPDPHEIARRFARSLDEEDYAAAARCIGPDCEYEIRGETLRGPAAILASYRDNAAWAARTLDSIRYESTVHSGKAGEVVVEFVDHIRHRGQALTHRCLQHLEFDAAGLIRRIRLEDLPGEREALQRFFESTGLPRSEERPTPAPPPDR